MANYWTVRELREHIADLADDQVLAIPIMWTKKTTEATFSEDDNQVVSLPDQVVNLTDEEWQKVATRFVETLGDHFWEDSYNTMFDAVEPYITYVDRTEE